MTPRPSRRSLPVTPPLRAVMRTTEAEAVSEATVAFEPVAEGDVRPVGLASADSCHPDLLGALSEPQRERLAAVLRRIGDDRPLDALEQMALGSGQHSDGFEAMDVRLAEAIGHLAKPGAAVDAHRLSASVGCRIDAAMAWAVRHAYPISFDDNRPVITNARGGAIALPTGH